MRFHVAVAEHQLAKTHCPQGHEYTDENTVRWPSQPRSRRCRTCQTKRSHDKYAQLGPAGRRSLHLKYKYGLSDNDFAKMLAEQDGTCLLGCGRPATDVDHDHSTGKVRGLLCHGCNAGLGYFNENAAALLAAADYVEGLR